MNLKPSQRIPRKEIDDQYDQLHEQHDVAMTERAALAQALENLLAERTEENILAAAQVLETLES